MKDVPEVAAGSEAGSTEIVAPTHEITRRSSRLPVQLLESVAVTVIGKEPVSVGVPERVSTKKLIPFGSVPVWPNVTEPTAPVCVNWIGE